jgi:hypothetical protein
MRLWGSLTVALVLVGALLVVQPDGAGFAGLCFLTACYTAARAWASRRHPS